MLQKLVASAAVFLIPFIVGAQDSEVKTEKKEWTILVFLNADNNLESYGYDDIREMEKIGSTKDVNVVVQFDGISPSGTPRFLVEKSDKPYSDRRKSFNSTILEDLPEQDMGDYRTLQSFVDWGVEKFPAKHYALIMWNHGSGWKKEDEPGILKGISFDDTSGTHITTLQMNESLLHAKETIGRMVDVVAFDACLMAMVEVVDGMAGLVEYVVAAEEVVPGMGFPYDRLLKTFTGREEKSARTLVGDMVHEFGLSYSGGSQGFSNVTLSALDLKKFHGLKKKLNTWIDSLNTRSGLTTEQMRSAADDSVSFNDSDYRDLGDYVSILLQMKLDQEGSSLAQAKETRAPGFISASLALQDAIDAVVVENFTSARYQTARGLSIYLPYGWGSWSSWSSSYLSDVELKNEYLKLSWASETTWTNHLDRLFPSR